MMDRHLQQQFDSVAARLRQLQLWRGLTTIFLTCTLVGGFLLWLNHFRDVYHAQSAMILAIFTACAVAGCWIITWRRAPNYLRIANQIESQYPELDCALITAIEQEPELPDGRYGYLQQQVIQHAVLHGFGHPWTQVAPSSRLITARVSATLGLILCAATVTALFVTRQPEVAAGPAVQVADITHVNARFDVTVEPGNAQVERNTGLLILARFSQATPPEVTLVYKSESGDVHRLPMTQRLDDPVFGARITSVSEPLIYHVAFVGQKSDDYEIGVFSLPDLNRADALLTYPSYTGMDDQVVQDIRHVSAVEGSELTLSCFLNKPVASAELIEPDGTAIRLDTDKTDSLRYATRLELQQSLRWELRLRDLQGRANRYPPKFVITVLPNRPPDLEPARPNRDVQVSPIEELDIKAKAWDDFGLKRIGISLSMPGSTQQEVVLGKSLAAKQRAPIEYTVLFEDLRAEPDQLLAYHFWAEDTGPDGRVRRVASDMYFAEVRHFEEIFRQGQQPTSQQQRQQQRQQQQGQGGNARQAQQLADLQKQIINATWKLIRRETSSVASDAFDGDITLLVESQQVALGQLDQLAEKIQDAESAEHVHDVRQQMDSTVSHLETAKNDRAPAALQPALAAEQAAYQALLKLRAREHEVVRSQQRQQQTGQSQSNNRNSNNRSQQQLQQLELQKDENRYEEQRMAQSQPETQADRENRQVLNRLRELARRQSDLNERIKELQSELQAAQNEADRQEIQRQLKRLRDEQQEILRDSDELKSRMEQPENQERMAEQQQQLDRAREQARQSSEALQEGMVSQAAASGSRAERELTELRDEFRRRLSTRLDEQLREMEREAQEMDERQAELSDQITELGNPERAARRLRDEDARQQIREGLQNQQGRVGGLLDDIEKLVEEAEQSEPLLAEQLYDTYRRAQQRDLAEALRSTQRSVDRGMDEDARTQERVARQGIQDLRKGIERSAESVLGDETEALRRARKELDRLSTELDQEIARNDRSSDRREPSEQQPGERPQSSQSRNGNQQQQNRQRRIRQRAEGDASERDQTRGSSQPQDQQSGDPQQNEDNNPNQRPGQQPSGQNRGPQNQRGRQRRLADSPRDAPRTQLRPQGGDGNRPFAPIAGDDFLDWSDRLRDVEEMIDDPELRAEAARIRDRAKGIRKDIKRHSKQPNWDLVEMHVLGPLVDLQQQVDYELLRRTAKDSLVPIDRDPVPSQYSEQVRLYYERLGRGR